MKKSLIFINGFLILILLLLSFSQAQASIKDCNLKPIANSKNYIIGYISLMDWDSRMNINLQAYRVESVMVKRFQIMRDQNGTNYKTTFNFNWKKDVKLNAIFYLIKIENLLKTDQRERSDISEQDPFFEIIRNSSYIFF